MVPFNILTPHLRFIDINNCFKENLISILPQDDPVKMVCWLYFRKLYYESWHYPPMM